LQQTPLRATQFNVDTPRVFALPALWHGRNKKLPKPFVTDRVVQSFVHAITYTSDG
jgi:hypothetical protein